MDEIVLTPEQEAEAEQIEDILKAKAAAEIRCTARLLTASGWRSATTTSKRNSGTCRAQDSWTRSREMA